MNIIGKARIFKNEKGNYSTSVSNKKEDGTYENMYIAVNLKKGVELSNNVEIDIKNGFISFYKTRENNKIPKLVITDFEEETTDITEKLPF